MDKIVYLETDEEITSVIDKIKKITSEDIILFFPKRAILIKSIVNLKLLKRQIDLLKKNVLIVTNDETGINLAKKSGFKISRTLEKKENLEKVMFNDDRPKVDIKKFLSEDKEMKKDKSDYDLGSNRDFLSVSSDKENFKEDDNQQKKTFFDFLKGKKDGAKKKRLAKKSRKEGIVLLPSFGVKSFLIFCLVSFIIAGIIFFFVLPKATISVVPKTEPYSGDLEVLASKEVKKADYDNRIIPGEVKNIEIKSQKKKFEATGEKDAGEKAKGEITVFNNYSSESQILVALTRFQSQGKKFYSLSETTVPGAKIEGGKTIAGQAKVLVEAEKSGEDYNIGSSNFIIPGLPEIKQKNIFGKSEISFSGGTSKKIKIVSEDNLNKAKESLLEEVFKKGLEDLKSQFPKDKIFIESIAQKEIIEVNTNGEINKEMDNFEMELKGNIWVMQLNKDDLKNVVFSNLNKNIPKEKFFIDQDIQEGISYENQNFDFGNGKLSFKMHIIKLVAWKLDDEMIKKSIKGKTSDEAKKYILETANVEELSISFWPFWVKKTPQIEKKIRIVLDTSKITDKIIK